MTPLTPQQNDRFDSGYPINAYVYIHQPRLVYRGVLGSWDEREGAYVALTPSSTVTGSLANVKPEMLVVLSQYGNADKGSQRVRGVTGGKILIGRASVGVDHGRITPSVGVIVEVYEDYRPFIKAPYIDINTLAQYKDETLWQGHAFAQSPVANMGSDRLILTDDDYVDVTLNAFGANPSYSMAGGTAVEGVRWDIGDGTFISGGEFTPLVTVRFNRGARYVSLTVTDGNGISQTTNRLYAVKSIEECTPAKISGYSVTPQGVNMSIEVNEKFLPSDSLYGLKILVAELERYDDTIVGYNERFTGWIGSESASNNVTQHTHYITLTLQDIGAFLRENNLFPQSVNIVQSIGGWYTMQEATIRRLIHYMIRWHTNILDLCDLDMNYDGDIYPFRAYTTSGGALWQDISNLATAFAHELTVDSLNTLRIVRDKQMQPTIAQAIEWGLPTWRDIVPRLTLTEDRYGKFTLEVRETPDTMWGFYMAQLVTASSPTVVGCVAPSNAPSHGVGQPEIDNLLVTSQNELNTWAGNHFAYNHANPYGTLTINVKNASHVVEPALRELVSVVMPEYIREKYNLHSTILNRWIVDRISYTYSDDGVKSAEYQLSKEMTAERMARTLPQVTNSTVDQSWQGYDPNIIISIPPAVEPPIQVPTPLPEPEPPAPNDGSIVMTWDDEKVWLTDNFKDNSPDWEDRTPELLGGEVIKSGVFGLGRKGYLLTYDTQRLRSRLWSMQDILSPPTELNVGTRWVTGGWVDGEFSVLRPSSQNSTLYIGGNVPPPPVDVEWEQVFDFTESQQGWTINQDNPAGSLSYISGVGFKFERIAGSTQTRVFMSITPKPWLSGDGTVEYIEMHITNRNTSTNVTVTLTLRANGTGISSVVPSGTGNVVISNTETIDNITTNYTITALLAPLTAGDTFVIERVVVKGTGLNPFQMDHEWVQIYDFETSSHGFTPDATTSQNIEWVGGIGWRQTMTAAVTRTATLRLPTPALEVNDFIIKRVVFHLKSDGDTARQPRINVGFTGVVSLPVIGVGETSKVGTSTDWLGRTSGQRTSLSEIVMQLHYQHGISLPNPSGKWGAISRLEIYGMSKAGMGNPFAPPAQSLVGFSSDDGLVFDVQDIGESPDDNIFGLDVVSIGNTVFTSVKSNILKGVKGGDFEEYGNLPNVVASSLVVPRNRLFTEDESNALKQPDIWLASTQPSTHPMTFGETVWVLQAPNVLGDVTPYIDDVAGVAVSPNCLHMSWQNGERGAAILSFDGERHLMTWDDNVWVDRETLEDDADYVRMRRSDVSASELYFINGGECQYSADYGETIVEKPTPSGEVKGLAVYG